ncbi:MAG: hypothetical protein CMJ88_06220 [Planctomycetes bacterium]|nr:hypothetical protein [Planctomycetota bacterium]
MTRNHRSQKQRAMVLGTAGLLLTAAAASSWWMPTAGTGDQGASSSVGASKSAAPPPGERLVGQKSVVRRWADNDEFADLWIYGDLEQGFEEAQQTGRPLLVTYRCVP